MMQRNTAVSVAKGIAIILMVAGHSGCPGWLEKFIYLFHIPFFFFVSGYFNRVPENAGALGRKILRRLKGLYLPFVIYGLIFIALNNLLFKAGMVQLKIEGAKGYLDAVVALLFKMNQTSELLGPFWFLKTLLLATISVNVLLFLLRRLRRPAEIILAFALAAVFVTNRLPESTPFLWDITHTSLAAVFYLCGMLYAKYSPKIAKPALPAALSLAALVAFTIFYPVNLSINAASVPDCLAFIFTGLAGSYLVLFVSEKIAKTGKCRFLTFCGDNSLHVLALHLLSFKLVSWIIILTSAPGTGTLSEWPVISNAGPIWFPAYILAGVLIPLALVKIVKSRQ